MNKKETPAAGRDAQLDLAAHPERPLTHGDSTLQYVAGFAYAESHPRDTALRGGRVGPTDKPQPTPVFSLALRADADDPQLLARQLTLLIDDGLSVGSSTPTQPPPTLPRRPRGSSSTPPARGHDQSADRVDRGGNVHQGQGHRSLRSAADCCFWTHGRVFAQVSVSRACPERRNYWTHDQLSWPCVATQK